MLGSDEMESNTVVPQRTRWEFMQCFYFNELQDFLRSTHSQLAQSHKKILIQSGKCTFKFEFGDYVLKNVDTGEVIILDEAQMHNNFKKLYMGHINE